MVRLLNAQHKSVNSFDASQIIIIGVNLVCSPDGY